MHASLHQFVSHGYTGLMVAALAEGLGVPLLLTPVIVAAGLLAANGELDLLTVIGVTTLAALIGDWIWFASGRRYGGKVINFLCRISLSYYPDGNVTKIRDGVTLTFNSCPGDGQPQVSGWPFYLLDKNFSSIVGG